MAMTRAIAGDRLAPRAHGSQITFVQDALRVRGYDAYMRWLCPIAVAACAHAPDDGVLRTQTQALMDAVTAGDAKVWDRYMDPHAIFVAETGAVDTKDTLLPQITPLPKGISGNIVVDRFRVQHFGDTAVAVWVAKETESFFGHPLTAEYLMTDTWQLRGNAWRLVASHVYVKNFDPPAVALPAEQLDEYAGTYRLTDEIAYTIRRDASGLVGERSGRKAQPLLVELRDVLFVAGDPRSRKIFQRDAQGKVTGFVDRREGHDVPWTRER
jgi:hypothetical protein